MRPRKVIVLVDCNADRLSERSYLLEIKGYRAVAFDSPLAAMGYIESVRPGVLDLVAAEVLLPEMDGNEFARVVRRLRPTLPVLLFSAALCNYDRASHADAFLPKGANSSAEFLEKVRIHCARKRGPKPVPKVAPGAVVAESEAA